MAKCTCPECGNRFTPPTEKANHARQSEPVFSLERGRIYLLSDFLKIMKWGGWAWRQARRKGIRPVRVGQRAYILSDDVFRYLEQLERD